MSKVKEELVRSKEVMSELIETQGSVPAEMGPKDRPLDSNDGLIKDYVVVVATKKRRYEFEEEEEATLLKRKKWKVSKGPEQPVKPLEDIAKDKESENAERAKLRNELKALLKEANKYASSASSKDPREEARVKEERNAEEYLPLDLEANQATIEFEREMMKEEMIEKVA